MTLQSGDDVLWSRLLRGQGRHLQHDADGDGVEVGVDEPTTVDSARTTDDLDVDTLAIAHSKSRVDDLLRQRDRFLHAEREVLRLRRPIETGFLGHEAVDTVASDHH